MAKAALGAFVSSRHAVSQLPGGNPKEKQSRRLEHKRAKRTEKDQRKQELGPGSAKAF